MPETVRPESIGRFVAVVGGAGLYDAYLVHDSFTDTNGTSIDVHVPEKAPGLWTENLGVWEIQSNAAQLQTAAGDSQNIVTIDASVADVTIEANITQRDAPMDIALVGNYTDQNNHWLGLWSGGNVFIFERLAGTYFNRNTGTATVNPGVGNSVTIRLVTNGDTITFFIGGVQKATFNTAGRAQKTATRHGFRDTGAAIPTPVRTADLNIFTIVR